MLFGLYDRPPFFTSVLAGFQHVLAVFGGILTAPLIIALGMGLSLRDTSYLVSSALLISGLATILQIQRIGPVGSGLLSIQGTSFSFIGPMIAAFYVVGGATQPEEALGALFGSSIVCAVVVMALSFVLPYLRNVITPNVTGATVILLGASLVWSTVKNIHRAFLNAEPGEGWQVLVLSALVFFTIIIVTRLGNAWLKLSSITIGLLSGYVLALFLGLVDFSLLSELDNVFIPEFARYPLSVDWRAIALLMPIFIISMMESVGDLTATSSLSGLPTSGFSYWQRIRGGVLGDSINSLAASVFCTFPNTTFSQNNGVIQLTGVCSRHVGFYVASILVLLGFFPIVGGIFQVMPEAILHGATLLMFSLVGLAGFRIVRTGSPERADWVVVGIAVVGGWLGSLAVGHMSFLPPAFVTVVEFPVTTGAFIALVIELSRYFSLKTSEVGSYE
jgi:NCS2 family nucleobase:cation symporter-2/xanthine permease XanP